MRHFSFSLPRLLVLICYSSLSALSWCALLIPSQMKLASGFAAPHDAQWQRKMNSLRIWGCLPADLTRDDNPFFFFFFKAIHCALCKAFANRNVLGHHADLLLKRGAVLFVLRSLLELSGEAGGWHLAEWGEEERRGRQERATGQERRQQPWQRPDSSAVHWQKMTFKWEETGNCYSDAPMSSLFAIILHVVV